MRISPGQAICLSLAVLLPACVSTDGPGPERTVEEGFALVFLEGGKVLQVELADTPEKLIRGYMFREHVGPEEGMLFRFPEAGFHSFWMKNCLVSLDIIWIGTDGRVVQIEENAPPCEPDRPCIPYVPLQRAAYVLELAAGQARRHGIGPGTAVEVYLGPDQNATH